MRSIDFSLLKGDDNMIYLDNASTAPLLPSVKSYIISILDEFGNPSSLYAFGDKTRQIIHCSRNSVAKFINTDAENIIFTSGGSASNTLAIRGYYLRNDCTIFYSPIAHKSIIKCVESFHNSRPLRVDSEGLIDIPELEKCLRTCINKPLVIIDHANSEIGTIQNILEITRITHLYNGVVYLDCTGSIPQIPIDVKRIDADMIGFSGHKIYALKGCGVLYKKKNIDLEPLIYGSQEQGYVGGTENVLGIASLGKAVGCFDYSSISSESRDYVCNYIMNNIPDSYLVGVPIESGNRLPHNLYMCFKGVDGELLMILLDLNGIQVSTGSACNSGNKSASATLSAIGMNEEDIHSCIRLTFSGNETKNELDYVCKKLRENVVRLRNLSDE